MDAQKTDNGIDFEERARVTREADKMLKHILSLRFDNFDQFEAVSNIQDLEVAKLIIKRLLEKVHNTAD